MLTRALLAVVGYLACGALGWLVAWGLVRLI